MLNILAGKKMHSPKKKKKSSEFPLTITFQMEALIKTDCQRIKELHFTLKSFYLSLQNLKKKKKQQQQQQK